MKVLVTGGAGFIGSAFIRHLMSDGAYQVVNVDKLTYAGNLDSLAEISGSPDYVFEQVDICDRASLTRVFAEHAPDVVVHLAAESHVDRSIDGPETCIQTNIMGTFHLVDVALRYHRETGQLRRFHHVSTDEVFGDLGPKDLPFGEYSSYRPSSPYAASKASADHLVRAWGRTYEVPFVVSNCSNNYGPYQYPEKLIPLTIMRALAGRSLPVYGDGQQIRDWLYVEDHALALEKIMIDGRNGETYLVGGRAERTNLEVVRGVCEILQKCQPRENGYEGLIKFVGDRPGHDRRYAIDPGGLERELGWRPLRSFESGLENTVRWYLANFRWLEGKETNGERLGLGGDIRV